MSALRPDKSRRLPSPHLGRFVASQTPRDCTRCPPPFALTHSLFLCLSVNRGSFSVSLSGCVSGCRSVGGISVRQEAVPGHKCPRARQWGDLESGEGDAQEEGGQEAAWVGPRTSLERCEGLGVSEGRVAELQLAVAHRDRQIEVLEEEVRALSKQGGALAQAKTAR